MQFSFPLEEIPSSILSSKRHGKTKIADREESKTELEKLCNRKDTTKLTLTRSKKEADKWRVKFSKYFYAPKG